MNSLKTLLAITSGSLAILSYYPYIKSINKGKTMPNRITFFIWSIIGSLEAASYLASGGGIASILFVIYTLGTASIFLLSLKKGVGGTSRLDLMCLSIALVGVYYWITTNNSDLAVYFSILAGILGYAPTLKKAFINPSTENATHWIMCFTAALLNLFTVQSWSVAIILASFYLIIFDGMLALLTSYPRVRFKLRV